MGGVAGVEEEPLVAGQGAEQGMRREEAVVGTKSVERIAEGFGRGDQVGVWRRYLCGERGRLTFREDCGAEEEAALQYLLAGHRGVGWGGVQREGDRPGEMVTDHAQGPATYRYVSGSQPFDFGHDGLDAVEGEATTLGHRGSPWGGGSTVSTMNRPRRRIVMPAGRAWKGARLGVYGSRAAVFRLPRFSVYWRAFHD